MRRIRRLGLLEDLAEANGSDLVTLRRRDPHDDRDPRDRNANDRARHAHDRASDDGAARARARRQKAERPTDPPKRNTPAPDGDLRRMMDDPL